MTTKKNTTITISVRTPVQDVGTTIALLTAPMKNVGMDFEMVVKHDFNKVEA